MARLLFRLLLIVSLVSNGVAAPWAMAKAPDASAARDHAAMASATAAHETSGPGCHHDGHHSAHATVSDSAGREADAATTGTDDRSCCDGSLCKCGCTPPSMLLRLTYGLPVLAWAAAPVAEPATRALARRVVPPFRPPAA